jgi:dihydrofolate synthase/folylpolyglutamate synthase
MTARLSHPEIDHPERAGLTPAGRVLLPAAMAYLNGLTGYEQTGRLEHPTIERMTRLVGALGDPQRAYPVIHLTGTNGKGSTAAMVAGLLSGQGLRVGT